MYSEYFAGESIFTVGIPFAFNVTVGRCVRVYIKCGIDGLLRDECAGNLCGFEIAVDSACHLYVGYNFGGG